jgi:hypothetical protein
MIAPRPGTSQRTGSHGAFVAAALETAVLLAAGLGAASCGAAGGAPQVDATRLDSGPPDPPASTEWHAEPVLEKRVGANVVLWNHADASLRGETILALLQRQYDWLARWCGFAPRWVHVHVGSRYPLGFMIRNGPDPEMFLQAASIFDTAVNYAHEMTHCFLSELGSSIPHWFNESMSDMAYLDSEIELWERRAEATWLASHDRVDYRSLELLRLRIEHGRDFHRRVCAELWRRRDDCRATFAPGAKLDARNELLVEALSAAAGRDVLPVLREMGFNPRTRERQRGY